jgi:hypothetical protein
MKRRLLPLLLIAGALGCNQHRSYMRHPLINEMDVTSGPVAKRDNATQADPYPPPRPALPIDPASVASTQKQ